MFSKCWKKIPKHWNFLMKWNLHLAEPKIWTRAYGISRLTSIQPRSALERWNSDSSMIWNLTARFLRTITNYISFLPTFWFTHMNICRFRIGKKCKKLVFVNTHLRLGLGSSTKSKVPNHEKWEGWIPLPRLMLGGGGCLMFGGGC